MSREHISGQSFDFMVLGQYIHADNITLSITDNSAVVKTRGIPDGYVSGDVEAEGEITLKDREFQKFSIAARAAGSYRDVPPLDLTFVAKRGGTLSKVEVFGAKLLPTDLLDIDDNGGSATTKKIKFMVTSKDFIRINGVPYLSRDDTRYL